jgi:hypothetical protein
MPHSHGAPPTRPPSRFAHTARASSFCPLPQGVGAHRANGWRTQNCRNLCVIHALFAGKKVGEAYARKSSPGTLKLGRLRARSFRPFLPAPRRTGQDTCRIIRLSGFLVSLTVAVYRSRGLCSGSFWRFASRVPCRPVHGKPASLRRWAPLTPLGPWRRLSRPLTTIEAPSP